MSVWIRDFLAQSSRVGQCNKLGEGCKSYLWNFLRFRKRCSNGNRRRYLKFWTALWRNGREVQPVNSPPTKLQTLLSSITTTITKIHFKNVGVLNSELVTTVIFLFGENKYSATFGWNSVFVNEQLRICNKWELYQRDWNMRECLGDVTNFEQCGEVQRDALTFYPYKLSNLKEVNL